MQKFRRYHRSMRPANADTAIRLARAGLIASLLLLVICGTMEVSVADISRTVAVKETYLSLERYDGLVTLQASNVSLQDILAEFARECNLRIILHRPIESRISATLEAQPLGEALTRLLRRQSYLLHLSPVAHATHVIGHQHIGTLWVYSGSNSDKPNPDIIEYGRLSDTAVTLAELQSQLARGDFRRRKAAIEDLREFGSQDAIETLSMALADDDSRIRVEAIHALADIGGDNTIAALAGASGDEDPWVRQEASYALGSIGGDSAIQQLKLSLHDADHKVRDAAITAFSEIGGQQSAAALSVLLRNEDLSTRVNAVDALGEIGGDIARPYLEEALNDENELVRERVAAYLKDAVDTERRNRF